MKTAIFNSLGSNYSPKFVWQANKLFFKQLLGRMNRQVAMLNFSQLSSTNKVWLTYKGRHAITLGLLNSGLKPGDRVGLQAFTCWAVEEAVLAAKMKPVFIDTHQHSVHLDVKLLKVAHQQHNLKALIVQHTFGFPADMAYLTKWARSQNIILIEDLAHAYGASIDQHHQAGDFGDITALSFGRDKIIDAVSGGGLIGPKECTETLRSTIPTPAILRDLLYPTLTLLIRQSYLLGLGRILHSLLKQTPLIVSPIANSLPEPSLMPQSHQHLLQISLESVENQLIHRRKIATLYQQKLDKRVQFKSLNVSNSANLRYPILFEERSKLIHNLKQKGYYLADIWFKQPVETGKLKVKSTYIPGSCPQAENLCTQIFNLPTHIQVSKQNALEIIQIVNKSL